MQDRVGPLPTFWFSFFMARVRSIFFIKSWHFLRHFLIAHNKVSYIYFRAIFLFFSQKRSKAKSSLSIRGQQASEDYSSEVYTSNIELPAVSWLALAACSSGPLPSLLSPPLSPLQAAPR
jgi:hypothetical protein